MNAPNLLRKLLLIPLSVATIVLAACGSSGPSSSDQSVLTDTAAKPNELGVKERAPTPEDIAQVPDTDIKYVAKELLVLFKEGVPESDVESILAQYSADIVGYIKEVGIYQVRFDNVSDLSELAAVAETLGQDNNVDTVTLNIVENALNYAYTVDAPAFFDCSDDSPTIKHDGKYYGYYSFHCNLNDDLIPWNEAVPGYKNWGLEATKAISAWEHLHEIDNPNTIKVGIIDQGILANHEDLPKIEVISQNSDDSDDSFSFIRWLERIGANHGTMIASIISSVHDNNLGVAGVYPAKKIYFYKLPLLMTAYSTKVAIHSMLKHGIKIINISIGFEHCGILEELSDRAAVVIFSQEIPSSSLMQDFLEREARNGSDFLIVAAAPNDVCEVRDGGYSLQNVTGTAKGRVILVSSTGALAKGITRDNIKDEVGKADGPPEGKKYLDYYKPDTENAAYGNQIDIFAPGQQVFGARSGDESWETCERKIAGKGRNSFAIGGVTTISPTTPSSTIDQQPNISCHGGNGGDAGKPGQGGYLYAGHYRIYINREASGSLRTEVWRDGSLIKVLSPGQTFDTKTSYDPYRLYVAATNDRTRIRYGSNSYDIYPGSPPSSTGAGGKGGSCIPTSPSDTGQQTEDASKPASPTHPPASVADENTNNKTNRVCYGSGSGNSFAAPFVTGAAAFVWSINPELTGDQVKKILVNSTDRYIEHLPIVNGKQTKYPMLNVAEAVKTAIKSRNDNSAIDAISGGFIHLQINPDSNVVGEHRTPYLRKFNLSTGSYTTIKKLSLEDESIDPSVFAFISSEAGGKVYSSHGLEVISVDINNGASKIYLDDNDKQDIYDREVTWTSVLAASETGVVISSWSKNNENPFTFINPRYPSLLIVKGPHQFSIKDIRISYNGFDVREPPYLGGFFRYMDFSENGELYAITLFMSPFTSNPGKAFLAKIDLASGEVTLMHQIDKQITAFDKDTGEKYDIDVLKLLMDNLNIYGFGEVADGYMYLSSSTPFSDYFMVWRINIKSGATELFSYAGKRLN